MILAAAVILPSDFSYGKETDSSRRPVTYGDDVTVTDDGDGGGARDAGIHIRLRDEESSPAGKRAKSRSAGAASSYDPRHEKWYSDNIKIKNQGSTGLCWAFSASTASEISRAYQSRDISGAGQLSPVHLGYFFYNRVNDPLGNTAGDSNQLVTGEDTGISDYTDAGGNNLMTFQAMAGWTGMAAESKVPFNKWSGKALSSSLAYDNDVVLRNADFPETNEAVKDCIEKNGSVAVSLYMNDWKYLDLDTSAYYCDKRYNGNHIATIIGWDDSDSRENFDSGSDDASAVRPESDGAWIVQNSYGVTWGDGGYFYVSYEDASLENAMSVEVQPAERYDRNFQYDGNAIPSMFPLSAGEKAANVFTVPSDGSSYRLKACGLTTYPNGSDGSEAECTVDVYTKVKDRNDPQSGEKVYSTDATFGRRGFHTVDLGEDENGIYLSPGSRYSIVVTVKDRMYIGAESSDDYGWVRFRCSLDKDQSFWYSSYSSSWNDAADNKFCARIKGFASTEKVAPSAPSSVQTSLYGYDDVKLSWKKVSGASGYRVSYRKSTDSSYRTLCHTAGTSVKKADLADGVKYVFRVESYMTLNGDKYYSPAKTSSIYTLKKSSGVKLSKASKTKVKVRWSGMKGASGYQTARSKYKSKKYSIVKTTGSTSISLKTARKKTYYYKVRAYSTQAGKKIYSPWSSPVKYRLK